MLKAKRHTIRDHILWDLTTSDGQLMRWTGLDEDDWWETGRHLPSFRRQTARDGQIYILDTETDTVEVLPPSEDWTPVRPIDLRFVPGCIGAILLVALILVALYFAIKALAP